MKTLNTHNEEMKESLNSFAIINEMYIRGFPMGKLEAFITNSNKQLYIKIAEGEIERLEANKAEMMCFCGELKGKYDCDGYCRCGAFIKNRRGYSETEKGTIDGYNTAIQDSINTWNNILQELNK